MRAWILAASVLATAAPQASGWRGVSARRITEQRLYANANVESVRTLDVATGTGLFQAWWPNGHARVVSQIEHDARHGEYRTYYESGAPFELRHYRHGQEEGVQQSWTEDGELYLNYEVRDGRRYGFVNAKPCLPVDGETR